VCFLLVTLTYTSMYHDARFRGCKISWRSHYLCIEMTMEIYCTDIPRDFLSLKCHDARFRECKISWRSHYLCIEMTMEIYCTDIPRDFLSLKCHDARFRECKISWRSHYLCIEMTMEIYCTDIPRDFLSLKWCVVVDWWHFKVHLSKFLWNTSSIASFKLSVLQGWC